MYSDHTLQAEELVKNILKIIEQDNGHNIEIKIQSETYFHTEEERNISYKN